MIKRKRSYVASYEVNNMTLTIADNQRTFLKNEEPFFYLADTCWSAFTNISLSDWEYYLQLRKTQGFNTLQINILPQWDASGTQLHNYPYPTEDKKHFKFEQVQMEYFNHARTMCQMAKAAGFELALVVLWCNYVPDTWANNMDQYNTMPYDYLETYIDIVHTTFSDLQPIYVISGDTNFPSERANRYYRKASDLLRQKAPACLQTMHICGRLKDLPELFYDCIDFYMYQSGHNAQIEHAGMAYELATHFYENYPKKPILNSEPCYEQMGFSKRQYGRFSAFDIRKAAWQSILSGACAGVSYGAHGIYSWHSYGKAFGMGIGEGFDAPNPWQQALHYPGAWDYGYIRSVIKQYGIEELYPKQELLSHPSTQIRIASNQDENLYLIYVPYSTAIQLSLNKTNIDVIAIALDTKQIAYPTLTFGTTVTIAQSPFMQDTLYVVRVK